MTWARPDKFVADLASGEKQTTQLVHDILWKRDFRLAREPGVLFFLFAFALCFCFWRAGVAMVTTWSASRLLLWAVCTGDLPTLKALLGAGADVDEAQGRGQTHLHMAAFTGQIPVVRALLAGGADANAVGDDGISAIYLAAREGHHDVVRTLVEHGVSVNAVTACGSTALHQAAGRNNVAMIETLLQLGANVDQVECTGRSPLHTAAFKGNLSAVITLLDAGADIYIRSNCDAHSTIDLAALAGHMDVVKAMIRHGADVNAADDSHGWTPLHFAACGRQVMATAALKAGEDTVCHMPQAPTDGHQHVMLALLSGGADVNVRNNAGRSPLHMAVQNAGSTGVAACVDILLRWGADEAAVDKSGKTAADILGLVVAEEVRVEEDLERVRLLLTNAPKDRAWRRRCLWALCRAYPDRVRPVSDIGTEKVGALSGVENDSRASGDLALAWTAAKLLDVPEYDIFRGIVEYL